jgi:hypothetical protein
MPTSVRTRPDYACASIFLKGCIFAVSFMAVNANLFGQVQSGGQYTIVNRATAQAVDDPGGTKTAGTVQQERFCNGNAEQNWTFTSNGSYYTIQNTVSLLYLDTNSSNQIVQNSKSGGTSQNWTVTFIGDGFYEIINEASNDALEVPNGNTNSNTLLDQTTNNDYPYQQWYITSADTCRSGQFSSSSSGWAAVPIPSPGSGQTNLLALFGTITMTNPNNSLAEDLFGVGFVPNGTSCANTSGSLPASSWSYDLKSVTAQTISVPINYWIWSALNGLGLPAPANSSNCMFMGFDGGYSATVNLAFVVVSETANSLQNIGLGAEACFNNSGCVTVHNLNPETEAYEGIYRITTASTLNFIWGNVSDATLTAPNGTWVATTDLYVFHGSSECSDTNGDIWYWSINAIPGDANHLMDLQENGVGSAVAQQGVFQTLNYPLNAGDCLVIFTGVPADPGNAQFDNQIQIYAAITPN